MVDGVLICGPETEIIRMNRSAEEMLGLSAKERDLPRAEADPNRLERILVNLISNALKYSEPGKFRC